MPDKTVEQVTAETKDAMHKVVLHAQDEFSAVRTGRATPAIVERLRVDYYGTETPLQQLAGFSVPEARVLVISPYDKGSMKAIEKAIQESDLGVQPNNDGVVIRLNFPQLTEERRKDLVKAVKAKAEDARVGVRNARRHSRQELEALEKSGGLSKDDLDRAEKELDKITNDQVTEIDRMLSHKEQELLEV